MSQRAIYVFAFLMSFTVAQAQEAEHYFGVSAIFDADLDYTSSEVFDDETNSGFILTYGRQLNETVAIEGAYTRYLDLNYSEGFLTDEITALEVSGVFKPQTSGAFLRLGYSNAEQSISSDTLEDFNGSDDDSGLIYGVGMDFDTPSKGGKFRVEYTIGDYDNGEIKRMSIGSFINF